MRVFISYSWDSDKHRERVSALVTALRKDGIGAEYDGDIMLGERIPHYMETRVSESDYVIFVCTPHYKEKADARTGGVGYESNIITGEIYSTQNEKKFIPILFSGSWTTSLPAWAAGKFGLDFTDPAGHESAYTRLLQNLNGIPPGKKVSTHSVSVETAINTSKKIEDADPAPIRIVRIISEEVGFPKNDGTAGSALYAIPFELSTYPSEIWKRLFIQNWNQPPQFSLMHRPGIARVVGKKIILDGTTIDEVEKYHKETLVLAVTEANKQEMETIRKMDREEKRKKTARENHLASVKKTINNISFDD